MVLFAIADIILSVSWHTSIFVLRNMYNGIYYLYYGFQPSEEEILKLQVNELQERIKNLEEKIKTESNE